MSLRINTNLTGMRSINNMNKAERKLAESLMRLSSGFKINKGADDPAGLVISEQMRSQIVGLNQAISNTEIATTMVQTAEGALTEVNNLLLRIRQLALHAVNEVGNDGISVEADQLEIQDAIQSMSHIVNTTQFGKRKLLDGTTGLSGEAIGEGLIYVSASQKTESSPEGGYAVEVIQAPERAWIQGEEALTEEIIQGLEITLMEGGRHVQVEGKSTDTVSTFFGRLKGAVEQAKLDLNLFMNEDGQIYIQHSKFGSKHTFQFSSSMAGLLGEEPDVMEAAIPGEDIIGTINGEQAVGEGQILRGGAGNEKTDGLVLRYTGPMVMVQEGGPDGDPVFEQQPQIGLAGFVNVINKSMRFQIGPNAGQSVTVDMPAADPRYLARNVETETGIRNLTELNVTTEAGARDAVKMVDAAVDQMSLMRGRLGTFQRNNLESNLANLRVTAENLTAAESAIRDTDVARELAEYTKQKILLESASAVTAQAGKLPNRVIDLIS